MKIPDFWKGSLEDIESTLKTIRKGKVELLCKSAGNRNIYLVEYGKRNYIQHNANYSSAAGAGNPNHYADKSKSDYVPTVLLIGAEHGGEFEGTVAILNLITLLETGRDLAGNENHDIIQAVDGINLLLIPCMNVDGRARVPFDAFLGKDYETFRYYSQGTWKDGSLCEWPDCKAKHPIIDHVDFLGSYFNDDGINLMHDNFFLPMAEETRALLKLCDDRVPDITIHLHGGSNTTSTFLQTNYVPEYLNHRIYELAQRIKKAAEDRGCPELFRVCNKDPKPPHYPPASFNLASACSQINGEVSIVYESNQGLDMKNQYTPEQIYKIYMIMFAEACRYAKDLADSYK